MCHGVILVHFLVFIVQSVDLFDPKTTIMAHFHTEDVTNYLWRVSRQLVYGHFVYDTSSTDISSTDISYTMTFLAEIEADEVMKRSIEPGLMQGILPN